MFAAKVVKEVTLDGGERVVIRKLNHTVMDLARERKSSRGAKSLRDFGGEIVKVLRSEEFGELKAKREEDPNAKRDARYNSFDRGTVLPAGIVSWTADTKLSPESIEDLDEPTADQLFHAIVDLSLPPLDPAVAEEKEKNV